MLIFIAIVSLINLFVYTLNFIEDLLCASSKCRNFYEDDPSPNTAHILMEIRYYITLVNIQFEKRIYFHDIL